MYTPHCERSVGRRVYWNVKVQTQVSWQHVQNLQIEGLGLVWAFLRWLQVHNRLYKGVSLDEQRMDLYPGAGYLPGVEVEESVIHDNQADPGDMLHCYVQGGDCWNI